MFLLNAGKAVSSGPGLLLDAGTLTASATYAYSTRKLKTGVTNAIRVVTSAAGNATQNIGFSGNDLDTASLASFIGSNTGTVDIWYDQMVNSNATQATLANQPRIVNAGTNETINSHTTLRFITGSGGRSLTMGSAATVAQPWTLAVCFKMNSFGTTGHLTDGPSQRLLAGFGGTSSYQIYAGSSVATGGTTDTTNVHTGIFIFNTTTSNVWMDGTNIIVNQSIGTNTMIANEIIGNGQGGAGFDGWITELIWFNSVLGSTDMATIRTSWAYWGVV